LKDGRTSAAGPLGFALAPEVEELRLRMRGFVDAHVLPVEADRGNWDEHENIRLDRLGPLRAKARAEGLWAPLGPRRPRRRHAAAARPPPRRRGHDRGEPLA